MKLANLEPQFVLLEKRGEQTHYRDTDDIAKAQGIRFLCPKCWAENEGPVGTHSILVWFTDRGVPADEEPGPGRWQVSGRGYQDLTLGPSISLNCWHGWVTNGEAQ